MATNLQNSRKAPSLEVLQQIAVALGRRLLEFSKDCAPSVTPKAKQ
jgi:hypothetical protein